MSTLYSDVYRTLAHLAFLGDVGSAKTGPPDKLLAQRVPLIDDSLSRTPTTGWERVWGPVIWKKDPSSKNDKTGSDNAWLVVHHPKIDLGDGRGSQEIFVTCIAGTNPTSEVDKWTEDAQVERTVDAAAFFASWQNTSIPQPAKLIFPNNSISCLAAGTAYGTWVIVSNPGPAGYPGAGQTLPHFLQAQAKHTPDATFIFTGHSLGGALSPVLAAGISLSGAQVYVFPLAGPTSGNKVFVNNYTTNYPSVSLDNPVSSTTHQPLNVDFYNTLDVVPKAWSRDKSQDRNLHSISSMYGTVPTSLQKWIKRRVLLAIGLSEISGITYTPLIGSNFTPPPFQPPQDNTELITVIVNEHITAYTTLFDITPLDDESLDAIKRRVGELVTTSG